MFVTIGKKNQVHKAMGLALTYKMEPFFLALR